MAEHETSCGRAVGCWSLRAVAGFVGGVRWASARSHDRRGWDCAGLLACYRLGGSRAPVRLLGADLATPHWTTSKSTTTANWRETSRPEPPGRIGPCPDRQIASRVTPVGWRFQARAAAGPTLELGNGAGPARYPADGIKEQSLELTFWFHPLTKPTSGRIDSAMLMTLSRITMPLKMPE
jgi:hypothetical protein